MITSFRRVGIIGLLVGVVLLQACQFYAGNLDGLAPSPVGVSVKRPPEIISGRADFVRLGHKHNYRTVCGFVWDWWWGWVWDCWSVWDSTDVWGDVILTLEVDDPSDDLLRSRSPRVHIRASLPGGGSGGASGCPLSVGPTTIPLSAGDVVGSGSAKSLSVRIPNVTAKFTTSCQVFSASLPVSLQFEDCSESLSSVNELRVGLIVPKP